ncbi:hypothetical protein [Neptunicoccus cionae]|uniref:Uncharacterized protein n=1 Tax=Neptunicoccus cionae TaxID=2035344 RepID=A0A916QW09_9RHOB|nr:hypothetical protein [Amylibacter cionae]GGA15228.1 hypothetical protein GCM10011498_14430 [Amylibacter cionae]
MMILINWMLSISLVVDIGLIVLWQSGIDIRRARQEAMTSTPDGRHREVDRP